MRVIESQVHGHDVVVIESDLLSLTVVAGKGADMVKFNYLPSQTEFLWESPQGMDVLTKSLDETRYIGGWLETFPNAWGECTYQGEKLRSYGDVWQRPWIYRILQNNDAEIQVAFSIQSEDLPLHLTKKITMKAGDATVRIDETAVNMSPSTVDFTWGHHPNFGRPFLNEDCVIDLPACEMFDKDKITKLGDWPYLQGTDGFQDLRVIPKYGTSQEDSQTNLVNMAGNWAALRNTRTGISFKLSWDEAVFTELLIWRSFKTDWSEMFGDNQIVCFFPKRSFSHVAGAIEKGEALRLEAGQSLSTWVEATVETGKYK